MHIRFVLPVVALLVACGGDRTADRVTDPSDAGAGAIDTGADDAAGARDADPADAAADAAGDAMGGDVAVEPDTGSEPDATEDPDTALPDDTSLDGGDVAFDAGDTAFDTGPDGGDTGADAADGSPIVVHVRDIWGELLPDDTFEMTITEGDEVILRTTSARTTVYADGSAWWTLAIAPDDGFEAVTVTLPINSDGTVPPRASDNPRAAVAVQVRGAPAAPIVHIGVPHAWFASHAAPARRGNAVRLLFNGEEAWRHVHAGLRAADRYVHIAIWWWESDFELVREDPFAPRREREANTITAALDATRATTRVIVWDNIALGLLNTDATIEDRGETPGDRFEYMPEDNPTRDAFAWSYDDIDFAARLTDAIGSPAGTLRAVNPTAVPLAPRTVDPTDWPLGIELAAPIASWHQKLIIVDGDEAWVSGMNIKVNDWDSSAHRVYDPRRMDIEASEAARRDVQARRDRPDHTPRRDYMAHVRGPVAGDVARVFADRWGGLLDAGAENADVSTPAPDVAIPPPVADGVFAQFVTTMPQPRAEYGLLESHLNAIRAASDYIFIEDQYWRAPVLLDALIERMTAVPSLQLVVITMPVSEWTDPGCQWTHIMNERLADRFAGRYHLVQLRSFATRDDGFIGDEINVEWGDINIHSKLMIVDDVFLSVGSGNKNNREYLYEGEANLNVYDPAWVRAARERLVANLLGVDTAPPRWIDALVSRSVANGRVADRWDDEGGDLDLDGDPLPAGFTPTGFVHPLAFGTPDDCFIEGIGADVTGEPGSP